MKKGVLLLALLYISCNATTTDGELDTTFGNNGIVTAGKPDQNALTNALVIRHDGKIVAGGRLDNPDGGRYLALAFFNQDGTMDGDFKVAQVVPDVSDDEILGLAVQPDNKLVAVGSSTIGTMGIKFPKREVQAGTKFIVARFNKDGTLDQTFNPADPDHPGIVEVDFFGASFAAARAVAFKRDGRIVAVGEAGSLSTAFYAAALLNLDGSLDNSFAAGAGRALYDTSDIPQNNASNALAVAIQSIGDKDNIVLAGYGDVSNNTQRFQIVRLTCNGDLDLTFANNGVDQVEFDSPSDERARGVDIYPDGKIVAVGESTSDQGDNKIAVTRRLVDGGPDNTFSGDGEVLFTIVDNALDGRAVNVQNDLKILVAGGKAPLEVGQTEVIVVRFLPNGNVDTADFGTSNGFTLTNFGANSESVANAIALQQDGKIVIAANTFISTNPIEFGLARYINDNTNQVVFVPPTIDEPENLSNCNTPQPTYSGKAQNPSNITVYITPDGVSPAVEAGRIITTDDKNEWSFTPPAPLAPGKHIAQIVAEYKSGNLNCKSDPVCCGVCLGPQSCISEAIREKYCSCIEVPIGC